MSLSALFKLASRMIPDLSLLDIISCTSDDNCFANRINQREPVPTVVNFMLRVVMSPVWNAYPPTIIIVLVELKARWSMPPWSRQCLNSLPVST